MKLLTKSLIALLLVWNQHAKSQGILLRDSSANFSEPDQTSVLHVASTTKGMLIPRLSTAQRSLIAQPALGLIVFDTDSSSFWFYNGIQWTQLVSETTDSDDQGLQFSGSTLSIEDGNSVDLSALQDGVNDADSNPANELQTISRTGTDVSLSAGGGTVSVADNDNSSTNEIQSLSVSGSTSPTINLSNNGGTISLAAAPPVLLTTSGNTITISSSNTGNGRVDYQVFENSGVWTKPACATHVRVHLWGGGGSGGRSQGGSDGAGGGGGGAYAGRLFHASELGATETTTIGNGGASKTTEGAGNAGNPSAFGTQLTANGGMGGGVTNFTDATGGDGGAQDQTPYDFGKGGTWGTAAATEGGNAVTGGGGGGGADGGSSDQSGPGGNSSWGGGGGGGSPGIATYTFLGYGGASGFGGRGGNGAGINNQAAEAGQVPGGGGGAHADGWNGGGTSSGVGGDGMCIVITYF